MRTFQRTVSFIVGIVMLAGSSLALGNFSGLEPETEWLQPAPEQRAPAQRGPQVTNGIAAVVEDRIITVEEVRREISLLLPQLQRDAKNEAEFHSKLRVLQGEVVQSLVDRVLVVKHFKREGYTVPQSFIENEMKDIIRQDFDGDRARFLAYLRSQGMSVRDFRKDLEERIIVNYMRGQMRRSESVVSPARMEQFYEEKKHTFYQDEAVHLRIIQLTALTNESDDILLQTADYIAQQLEEGVSFADLARRFSQDRRRREGGSWGWIKTDELREDWREIIANMEKGETSEPLTTREGIFILYLDDYREAGIQPIHQVRDQIETILASQMAREAQERWLERLRRNAYVRFYL